LGDGIEGEEEGMELMADRLNRVVGGWFGEDIGGGEEEEEEEEEGWVCDDGEPEGREEEVEVVEGGCEPTEGGALVPGAEGAGGTPMSGTSFIRGVA
jgi:hypothetical protein